MNIFNNMKATVFGFILTSLIATHTTHAAQIDFSGQTQSSDLTGIPHVFGATMWGAVDSGIGMGITAIGLTSLGGLDLSKFIFTFGDLELTSYQIATATTAGFEIYSEGDASVQPIRFFYDGNEWAVGTLNYLQIDVDSYYDFSATGFATANLTAAGASDDAFFNEVMSITGGSGLLTINADSFFPVDNAGLFDTTGTIIISPVTVSAVPEPEAWTMMLAGLGLVGVMARRRSKL